MSRHAAVEAVRECLWREAVVGARPGSWNPARLLRSGAIIFVVGQGIAGSTHWLPGGAGIVYNAQMLETIAREIASAIGWRATAPNAR